jgi:RNA polymerase sigma-70 factor (ECF subfamily)
MAVVHPLPFDEDDASLVEAVRRRQPGAAARLYDRHVDAVYGFLFRLLGPQPDLEDLLQDVFASALSGIDRLREPASLRQWLLAITVGRARTYIRSRRRKRWLSFLPFDEVPEQAVVHDESNAEIVREVCKLLDMLPAEERLALVVHRVQGLSLNESAEACGTSVSTFKRRLARGENKFFAGAGRRPALASWLEGSSRDAG